MIHHIFKKIQSYFHRSPKSWIYAFTIIRNNLKTEYGKKYNFTSIKTYQDFCKNIPIVQYDNIKHDIQRMIAGEENILTSSTISNYALSSGTTSVEQKLIPLSKEYIENNMIGGTKNIILDYILYSKDITFFLGEAIILGGYNNNDQYGNTTGFVSALMQKYSGKISGIFKALPDEIAFEKDRTKKVAMIHESCKNKNITSISGLTSRLVYLLEYIIDKEGIKCINDLRPNLKLIMTGGMNYKLYQSQLNKIFGGNNYNVINVYNASEGFFGYDVDGKGLKLISNNYIFFEFEDIQTRKIYLCNNLKKGHKYSLIITNSSGLYRYKQGDILEYIGNDRFVFNGRTQEYLESFGEHITANQTDACIESLQQKYQITQYSVGSVFSDNAQGCHHWVLETDYILSQSNEIEEQIDSFLKNLNGFYKSKRENDLLILKPKVTIVKKGSFNNWLAKNNKLGGQFKVPKLRNNDKIICEILDTSL